MSDDGHRDWVAQNKTSFIGVTIPVAFLNAHAEESSKDTASPAPTELDRMLRTAWAGAPSEFGGNTVTVACRIEQLAALAEYAEQCMTSWKPSRRPGPGRKDLHIAAASTLATHVRHTISRESQ